MQLYCNSLTTYSRLKTLEVKIGDLTLGNFNPIRLQTMTTTDTMDTIGTVEQTIRCIEAGAELVRITAPSKKEAENLLNIKNELRKRGYTTPLVADIHFTPNAAEIAARIIEKVRVNPGNYVDKKKFDFIEYTDAEYNEEIERIRTRFTPLIKICKEYGTAMRIGTNHGSLSDRIMSRYGDTPMGMVESAMEFLRIARDENYHNIVLSMKASNPQVMVQAYRLLIQQMTQEFSECYPLHLGVTEAGDGEDGRVKSAAGIGTLLEDGIGDTIRVSLTEDPEFEIPVCKDLVKRYTGEPAKSESIPPVEKIPYDPFNHNRRKTFQVDNIGSKHVPVVIADLSKLKEITPKQLESVGYTYDEASDKWNISDAAADYIFTGHQLLDFALPGTLKVIVYPATWELAEDKTKYFPIFQDSGFAAASSKSNMLNFVMVDCFSDETPINNYTYLADIANDETAVLCLSSTNKHSMPAIRRMFMELMNNNINNPVIITTDSYWHSTDEHLIHYSTECGALFLDGFGDGICLGMTAASYALASENYEKMNASGRNYLQNKSVEQFINNTAFTILQATRTRISKTEYISCPSCGRTLFDLQETTAKIRSVTNHLKGVKIAIMGCIVNGPGEMADADFGYVGSGVGKITLYKGKEVVKRNVDSDVAVEELINLLKESDAWVEPQPMANLAPIA
ncbi:(E)-4-hydroxy-3-methylbut-2-enyl-diphosphate synthase [Danxiaibacter flavus]|uniref:4-hydroxy-3-methylbut-2-en-1-yl diphosphate synthase (flavodoxin) n=1 Tax=Danxiaibacter flavus TaxID=3049108 RepID=A0ABV3Z8C8_9BACT|nr:(E)-4-hydroxy-3-methylbut-2-enyl-diphosphate synthase [Chitinophagaceae bacterium DXS]